MAYQILGLRDYLNKKTGKLKKRQVFYERQWRIGEPELIFKEPTKVLEGIPENERVNLYFTVADCFEGPEARKLREQWLMPFDIDDLGLEGKPEEIKKQCLPILEACCSELMLDASKTAALYSGNGLQFFVKMHAPILSEEYFDTMREHYKVVCDKLQARLALDHIRGKVDDSVFSAARLMRLPETWNEKPNKGKKWAFVVQPNLVEQDFVFDSITGDAEIKKADTINKEAYKLYAKPDKKSILSGCAFLKHCKEKPNDVSEHQWYAMLGVTAFLQDGEAISHDYSSGYAKYDAQETQEKYEQAIRASGPRTCKDIGTRWDGCKSCAHYGTVTSPIGIRGEDYMATAETGFRDVRIDKHGIPHPGPVNYDDLQRQFMKEYEYIKVDSNGMYTYSQEERVWNEYSVNLMGAWARKKIDNPSPSSRETSEFIKRMSETNVKPADWLNRAESRFINFNNGVLDQTTMTLLPHESKYGFKHILPYNYDPRATAPLFEKFLDEIMCSDQEAVQTLKEFLGYCLSGDEYWEHKALVLLGEGYNGKSVLMETMELVAGEKNVSNLPMRNMERSESRHALVNKLYNYSDETSIGSFAKSDIFKALSGGSIIQVRELYSQEFDYRNKAKLVMSCNKLPANTDTSLGMFRRIIIVPFNKSFTKENRNTNLKHELKEEASGIYNILFDAYRKMKERKNIFEAEATSAMLNEYKIESDTILQFFNEEVEENPNGEVPVQDLFFMYETYCKSYGMKDRINPISDVVKKLYKTFPNLAPAKRIVKNGKKMRVISGISLQGGADY